MPRQPRLDAPESLHHVMVRGLDRQRVFREEADYANFLARVAALAEAGAWTVLAWALLPNHAHLLVRTGTRPLARNMRSLLTGYAGAFNRRHRRTGHLFQNRYKSVVVEAEAYQLELIRYLHLNPLRAGLVPTVTALARYPWTGHPALLGTRPQAWQATTEVWAAFGPTPRRAQAAYQTFVAAGVGQGRRLDLQGGGLVRSAGGWAAVAALRRGREAYHSDERVLGSSEFVEQLRRTAQRTAVRPRHRVTLEELLARVCRTVELPIAHLTGGARTPRVSRARAGLAYLWVEVLGRPSRPLAAALGVQPAAIPKAARRGLQDAREWEQILGKID